MEYCVIKSDVLENLKQEISNMNKTLLSKIKKQKDFLYSTEFIKITYSENLIEDIDFLNEMSGNSNFKVRYANMIIRDVLEQVIEFIYLLKHTDLIEQFFGANINTGDLDEENLIDEYLQFGGKRYNGGRKRVFQMASSINENASVDNTLSLYDNYRILSEQCHNSYFLSTLDDIEEIETNKKAFALTEEQLTYLMIIISRFMEAYRK